MSKIPLVLMILDGWGHREDKTDNAIAAANTPQWDYWWNHCTHCLLDASGGAVGLPHGQMGNSEVGHMHMGAGRLVAQDLTRIHNAIEDRTFFKNVILNETLLELKKTKKTLHLMGLLSPGGVHSHEAHLFALLELCAMHDFSNVALHLFLDGRDTPPQSAMTSLGALNTQLHQYPVAKICSLTGRYYAMDRDKHWSRLEPLYDLLTTGDSETTANTPEDAIARNYKHSIHDEFIPPTRIGSGCAIQSGDAVCIFNFRADRARQLTEALTNPMFNGFQRKKIPPLSACITMTQYSDALPTQAMFPPLTIKHTLGEQLSLHGLRQLRLAETEKYAHVTFFFNGRREHLFPLETRILIPSPNVATYDLAPEMSAVAVTNTLVKAIHSQLYDVIICNYANADMVGHTGNFNATVRAIESLDHAMQRVGKAIQTYNGHLFITADHGNAECMFDPATNQMHTAHTNQPVPFLYYGNAPRRFKYTQASLIDIAPTILDVLGLVIPNDMTGKSLFTTSASSLQP